MAVDRQTVDLSAYPDLVVIYLWDARAASARNAAPVPDRISD